MDKALNKEILRLSIPSIFANITVPLVGLVDTAVAGHLPNAGDGKTAAVFIGAVSVGGMLFSLLYWGFAFLRTGTGGLAAQAFGRRDMHASALIFSRGAVLAIFSSILILLMQEPFLKLLLLVTQGSPEVEALAGQYFHIRIWAAPATISLMVFRGWFAGMQDSMSSMWTDLVVNVTNIMGSIVLALGLRGTWQGIGFNGIAAGTVLAQYCGLLFAAGVMVLKYRKVFEGFEMKELKELLVGKETASFFKMNANLFMRSVFFTAIYVGYTMIAASYGDTVLAISSMIMQILMLFSYFTDGFAFAAEALSGRFIGEGNPALLRRSVRYVFVWSMGIAVLFMGIYSFAGSPLLNLVTKDSELVQACRPYLPWLVLMPPLGCAAFTWDGVYLGATASKSIRNAMFGAAISFLAIWYSGKSFADSNETALHILMAAYFAHLAFRTLYLSLRYKKDVLRLLPPRNS